MNTSEIHGTHILVVGYGREGKSVESWLKKHFPQLSITVTDEKENGPSYLQNLSRFDTVIRSPGVSLYLPELMSFEKSGGYITSATNIFFSLVIGKTIGITGTKGKSTTTSLIAHLLSSKYSDVRLVGNIGFPMLDALDTATEETIFVIELSSHQLADCRYSPNVAVMLGIVPEHLDYYPDLATYAQAKSNITLHQKNEDVVVFNPEHTLVRALVHPSSAQKITYKHFSDTDAHTFLRDGRIFIRKNENVQPIMNIADVPLLGNIENVLAAITVADLMDIDPVSIDTTIRPFRSLPHRLEFVGEFRGIKFYNDSLATIPQATIHALESLDGKVSTLIAGGYDRHLDFTELGTYLRAHPVSTLILFPDTGERILTSIGKLHAPNSIKWYAVQTMEEAVKLAYEHTVPGTICLLSPASASYNLFKNYEDRGNQFKAFVRDIGSK